jgi:uncharacterized protein (TIRG00374 family)
VTVRTQRVASQLLRLLLRLGVAAAGLVLAFRLALPASIGAGGGLEAGGEGGGEGNPGVVGTLLAAWQIPVGEALLWFALAWTILGVSLAVGTLRFQLLLRGAELSVRFTTLFRAYLVATFFNLVLPGAILGDVYRFWDARRDTGEGGRVLGIVVLERVLSLAALGMIALVVAPFVPASDDGRRLLPLLVAVGAVFVGLGFAVLLPSVNQLLGRLVRASSRASERLAVSAERALAAVGTLASRPAVVAQAFGWSLVNQGLPVAALMVLAVPLDAWIPWYWFAVIVPFVTLVALLPISIGGAGVRELLYVSLFGAVGMRPEAALALSLSVLAAAILWALLGLVIFATGQARASDLHSRAEA